MKGEGTWLIVKRQVYEDQSDHPKHKKGPSSF